MSLLTAIYQYTRLVPWAVFNEGRGVFAVKSRLTQQVVLRTSNEKEARKKVKELNKEHQENLKNGKNSK